MTRSEQVVIAGICGSVLAVLLLIFHQSSVSSSADTPTAGGATDPETAEFSRSLSSTPAGLVGSVSGTVLPAVPDADPYLSGVAAGGGEAPATAPAPAPSSEAAEPSATSRAHSDITPRGPEPEPVWSAPCVASWYGEDHRGLTTASGAPFNPPCGISRSGPSSRSVTTGSRSRWKSPTADRPDA